MTREDLKLYKINQDWIKGRMEYIEEYKTSITKITTVLSDMPKGSKEVQDSMADKIAELLDMVNTLSEEMLQQSRKQYNILEQLNKVEQPYRIILEKIYIQGKKLVDVASEMGYDYKYMCKMNGNALNKFANTINHEKKG